jgi:hypothetical protein
VSREASDYYPYNPVLTLMATARPRTGDPVEDANHQTTMADLRAAICLAGGISPDDIGPLGHDHSAAGWARVKKSWLRHIEQFGLTMFDSTVEEVQADWRRYRPDLAQPGDDWREEGAALHRARYPEGDCRPGDIMRTCVICDPVEEYA